ncbi:MAG: hypothetical protein HYX68_08955 [Planctomycetes bacterium]|nr:hypothetical protein [Planctomycetota bacterium]
MNLQKDTPPDVERLQADIYRKMPFGAKAGLVRNAWTRARDLHAAGVRLRRADAGAAEIHADWLKVLFGPAAPSPRGAPVEENADLWTLVFDLVHILERFDIRVALGGSMASSIFGKPRFTEDADLTVEPFPGKEEAFGAALDAAYYVSLDTVKRANRESGSFNIIHTTSGFKIDVFVKKNAPFEESAFGRRRRVLLANDTIQVFSPEDIILFKLAWFRLGGQVSDRQWGDILGVLQVQRDQLDYAYLEQWAAQLGLAELLREARKTAS